MSMMPFIFGNTTYYSKAEADARIAALEAENKTLRDELLRVRTTGHGAAHELDNIAIECGLGHSPKPGIVAEHVRRLNEAGRVLARECVDWHRDRSNKPVSEYAQRFNNPTARAWVEEVSNESRQGG